MKSLGRVAVIKILLAVMGIGLLASCSLLSPIKMEHESAYMIEAMPQQSPIKHYHRTCHHGGVLLVMPPEANFTYHTRQMAYALHPYQIEYFTKNRWADTPANMLLPLIVQTLQNTRAFKAVVAPPFMHQYDYVLYTELVQLLQDERHQPAIARFILRAQLIKASTNRVIATKQFSTTVVILHRTPYDGVVAVNHAVADVLSQLAAFCVAHVG